MSIRFPFKQNWLLILFFLLPLSFAYAVDFGKIRSDEIGYYVADLSTGQVLAAHREDVAMNPASTMKLLTSFAALNILGPDFRWTTQFRSNAQISNGILHGDLYWVGSGDPVFDQKDLLKMIQEANHSGIRKISGRLVLDKSIWSTVGTAEHFDDDGEAAFTTAPDAHMLAYKVAWLNVEADDGGKPVVKLEPPMPDVVLNSTVTMRASGACRDIRHYLKIKTEGGLIDVTGSLPSSCIGKNIYINILSMDQFVSQSLKAHWTQVNQTRISGDVYKGIAPSDTTVLTQHNSPSLAAVLKTMNKHSNNVVARTIFLAIGVKTGDYGQNTIASAERAMRLTFAKNGLYDNEDLIIENGSGLSRRERVTPRFMGEMLKKVYDGPHRDVFVDSLPIAGVDGTLKYRLANVGPRLKMKTGTLKNVRALAGFWLPEDGGRALAIVVIVNSPDSVRYLPDLDHLVTELVKTYG